MSFISLGRTLWRPQTVRQFQTTTACLSKYRKKHEITHTVAWLAEAGQPLREINVNEYAQTLDDDHKLVVATETPRVIVKVIPRGLERLKRQQAKESKAKTAHRVERKEFQFTWSTASNDLERKLGNARKLLEQGGMVDIVFTPKSKTKAPPLEEMRAKMKDIEASLAAISVPYKKSELVLRRGMSALYLRGVTEEQAKELQTSTNESPY
ncbi:hypothetical protein CYLTODRAFT_398588 [Cylindrobasidium torrendii FP15055 ss-10]|uniref:Translation initiation factor 3 N-terminal domain-containing protein n=1 Tax=Cylindrobasidium torrendii FP15055 ss-10 TaxID=1314674 RepID=A0A0D7B8N2_9AGAR|nr:hypothetical protein CYLTODRAFT_398588 [Cylindrobasidium torrendii FP15055 ss-10]